MKVLRWSPEVEDICIPPDCDDKSTQCKIKKSNNKQWYKKSISIPLWALSTTLLGAVSVVSFVQYRKKR